MSKFRMEYIKKHPEHWSMIGLCCLAFINVTGSIAWHFIKASQMKLFKGDDLYDLYKCMDKKQREKVRRQKNELQQQREASGEDEC